MAKQLTKMAVESDSISESRDESARIVVSESENQQEARSGSYFVRSVPHRTTHSGWSLSAGKVSLGGPF